MKKEMLPQSKEQTSKGQLLKETVRKNKFYTVVLALLVIALPILTIQDINKVEAGQAASERVFFPVAVIYNYLGYWPAVLFLPTCIIALATFIMVRFILPRKK